MKFLETILAGAQLVVPEIREDDRGYFSRSCCSREFQEHGLSGNMVQSNVAFNRHAGTVRGLHCQVDPSYEAKLIRCTRGSIYDVIVDLRPESETYLMHLGVILSSESGTSLYVPAHFAHGYQSLEDNTEVTYLVSDFYHPELDGGLRHDDPVLGIQWPLPVAHLSEKDRHWPYLPGMG